MPTSMEDVFEFVSSYKVSHGGNSPSYDEIADALGIGKTTVKYHLERLEESGKIVMSGIRGIQIPGEIYNIGRLEEQ